MAPRPFPKSTSAKAFGSKTVQALLRHSDVRTTLQLYAHSVTEDRMAAQELALQAILGNSNLLAAQANC